MAANRFEELQAFVTVVEQSGFTAAADKLGVVKSSLSRRVSELEQRLGVQLLHRTTRKLSLTDEGEQFFQRALAVLAELEEAEQMVSSQRLQPRGRIRIAAPMSFAQAHLAPVLVEFMQNYPDISLELDLNDRQVDLIDDGFDLALRIGDLADSTLKARKLGIIRFATVASPGYLERHGTPRDPAELMHHKGLYYTNVPAQLHWQYQVDGRLVSEQPQRVLSSNNGDFLLQAAARGLGIATSPTFILYHYRERGELVPILTGYPHRITGLHALFPPGRLVPARVRLLVDYLLDRFGEKPYWDKLFL